MIKPKEHKIDLIFQWSETDENVFRLEAYQKSWTRCAVGIAYVDRKATQNNKCEQTLYLIEVLDGFKRQGVGTRIHQELEKDADVILTTARNKRSERFLLSRGYVFDKKLDLWVWNKKKGSA